MRAVATAVMLLAVIVGQARAEYGEATFYAKTVPSYTIPTPVPGSVPPIIGKVQVYRVRKGDTLMDLARLYSLGYNEIVEANPDLDPWVPPIGATILLPTEWVLPCCHYNGIVVNIPEMRLFFYRPGPEGTTVVHTFPVGLGRDEWRTPSGTFKVTGKTVNPQWNIPESIRKEHIEERGDARTFIPGGDPDNPLGKHRIELTLPAYRIHGTNIPWGVGMNVSNGCARLYPEDVEHLFPLVPVGTPGAFVYQPVKVGRRDGRTWVEAHRDVYRYGSALPSGSRAAMKRFGVAVNDPGVKAAVKAGLGVPMALTPSRQEHASRCGPGVPRVRD